MTFCTQALAVAALLATPQGREPDRLQDVPHRQRARRPPRSAISQGSCRLPLAVKTRMFRLVAPHVKVAIRRPISHHLAP